MINKILIALAVLLVGGIGFYGGMRYQQNKGSSQTAAGRGAFRQGTGMMGRNGGTVRGEITNADNKSISVKLSDGSSKLVILSNSTAIFEATAASKTTLQAGKQVLVFGTTNSDGSITASNVQLNPQTGRPNQGASQ